MATTTTKIITSATDKQRFIATLPTETKLELEKIIPDFSAPILVDLGLGNENILERARAEKDMYRELAIKFPSLGTGSSIPSLVTGSNSDRLALIDIYKKANGHRWYNNMNWNSNVPIGSWHGVTVEAKVVFVSGKITRTISRVTRLDLSNNGLSCGKYDETASISPRIGDLSELKFLNLSHNTLQCTIPARLFELTNLEELYLHYNYIYKGISSSIGKLKKLVKLQLDHNRLDGVIPSQIGSLTNLEVLCLHENELRNSLTSSTTRVKSVNIPASFANLSKLNKFYVYGNHLIGKAPQFAIANEANSSLDWKITTEPQQKGFGLSK